MDQYIRIAVIAFVVWASPAPQLMAQEPDIEAMKRSLEAQIGVFQRLNELERRVTTLEKKGGDSPSTSVVTPKSAQDAPPPGSVAGKPPAAPPATEPSNTTVCRCQGYKEHLCLCLKAGVKCHCSRTVGSVWSVNEQGRATHKTGAKADPRIPSNPGVTQPTAGYPVSMRGGFAYWTDSVGKEWYSAGSNLAEGTVFGNRFTYRNGAMHEPGHASAADASQMAANIAPKGHFETRRVCRGSYCENVRVWVPE
jgi:hypothetical protein